MSHVSPEPARADARGAPPLPALAWRPAAEPAAGSLRRILVPLNDHASSEAILPVVESLARDSGAVVRLLRVMDAGRADALREDRAGGEAAAYLTAVAEGLRERGVTRVFWSVWYATPERAICRAATQNRVDLIAIGAHGRRATGRPLLGPVAEHVVREAAAAVLLLTDGDTPPPADDPILVALDGSETAAEVLPVAARLATIGRRPITLVRVVEPVISPRGGESRLAVMRAEAGAYLAEVARALEVHGVRTRPVVGVGPVTDVILQAARESAAGLIAMTARPRGRLAPAALGGVAARVLERATTPVLCWRGRRR